MREGVGKGVSAATSLGVEVEAGMVVAHPLAIKIKVNNAKNPMGFILLLGCMIYKIIEAESDYHIPRRRYLYSLLVFHFNTGCVKNEPVKNKCEDCVYDHC